LPRIPKIKIELDIELPEVGAKRPLTGVNK
jgi:hypothetical protein